LIDQFGRNDFGHVSPDSAGRFPAGYSCFYGAITDNTIKIEGIDNRMIHFMMAA
jgi:hypothetical protein